MGKSILRPILLLIITVAIFYLIFSRISVSSVLGVLLHSQLGFLLIAFFLTLLFIVIQAKRYQILLEAIGYSLTYQKCLYVIMGAIPLSSITPSKAGDVIRAYYLKDEIPASKTIGSVITERVFDILSLILFSLVGLAFYEKYDLAGIALIILAGIIAMFVFARTGFIFRLPLKSSWNEKLHNIAYSMERLTSNKRAFFTIMAYSLFLWFLSIIQTVTFFYALDINIPLLFTMANIPIAIIIGLVPVTLGGMGTRDGAIIFLFSGYATPSQLLGVGILFSLFRYWLVSLAGIPFMKKMIK